MFLISLYQMAEPFTPLWDRIPIRQKAHFISIERWQILNKINIQHKPFVRWGSKPVMGLLLSLKSEALLNKIYWKDFSLKMYTFRSNLIWRSQSTLTVLFGYLCMQCEHLLGNYTLWFKTITSSNKYCQWLDFSCISLWHVRLQITMLATFWQEYCLYYIIYNS